MRYHGLHLDSVGDVQHVEAKNSILRVMSTRARAMHRDLMSARHVIKSNSSDIVPADTYTKSFRKQCKKVADSFYSRYVDVPIVKPSYAPQEPLLPCLPNRFKSVVRIVAEVRRVTDLFDVILLGLEEDGVEHTSGVWLRSLNFRKSSHGLRYIKQNIHSHIYMCIYTHMYYHIFPYT